MVRMNRNVIIVFIFIVAVVASAVLLFRASSTVPKTSDLSNDSLGLIVGSNAIYVAEQAPSRTIAIDVVRLEKSGFVVVHEDASGEPSKILGASGILGAGETRNIAAVPLSRITRDGETLYAMIHVDDGDGVFDPLKDKPALDSTSAEPVMTIFNVSADATEPSAVSL